MLLFVLLVWMGVSGCEAVLDTPCGQLQGLERTSRDGRAYLAWTRIPYAKPPVGQLRLAAPVPFGKWEGILNATQQPAQCAQFSLGTLKGQEDCLYLNVFKPMNVTGPLPVLAYIHGGGFKKGDVGPPNAPDYIMDEDVVLVSIAYRLGALGFMTTKDVKFPGNYGLKDQALALKWVKENIGAFGGDPNSITVIGISAGGASAHNLLLSPLTRDIVTRAIPISGLVSKVWGMRSDDQSVKNSLAISDMVGCKDKSPQDLLQCLRGKDHSLLLRGNPTSTLLHITPLCPTIEPEGPGAFAPFDLTQVKSTKPLILGYSEGEHLLVEIPGRLLGLGKGIADNVNGTVMDFLSTFCSIDKERVPLMTEKVIMEYFNGSTPDEVMHSAAKMMADASFVYQALTAAKFHQGQTWLYNFDYRVPCHADEVFLLFNMRGTERPQNPEDVRMSKEFIKYIANFARFGNPTPEGSPLVWKPFQGRELLRIARSSAMVDDATIEKELHIRDFWAEVFGTNEWYK